MSSLFVAVRFPVLGLLACSLASCSGRVDSGLDPEQRAGNLSGEEAELVCLADRDHFEATVSRELDCKLQGVSAFLNFSGGSDAVAQCESVRAECEASNDPRWTCGGVTISSECDRRVHELETCLGDFNSAYGSAARRFPGECEDLEEFVARDDERERRESNDLYPFPPRPEACVAIGDECFYD